MAFKTPLHRIAIKPFDFDEWDHARKRLKELGWATPNTEEHQRAKASVDMGTVLEIGPTAFNGLGECPVVVGDIIAYVKNCGKFVEDPYSHQEIYVINDEDVVMVFKKEAE